MIEEPPGPTDLYEIIDDYRETRWDRLMMWPTIFYAVTGMLAGYVLGVMIRALGHVLAWFYYTFLDRGEEERTIRNLQG